MNPRDRLPPPPSSVTGPLGEWCLQVWQVVNATPKLSYFSGTSPNSSVTGFVGDFAVNINSSSTDTRVWSLGGSGDTLRQTGWVMLRTATP